MKRFSLLIYFVLVFFVSYSQTKDNFGYQFYEVPYQFIDIKTTGTKMTELSGGQDLVSSAIDLGQNFEFYGTNYNQMRVGIDGFITFDISSIISDAYLNTSLPNTSGIPSLVALYWNDLSNYHPYNDIYYQIDAEKIIIQWDTLVITHYGDFLTAQIVLDYVEKSIQYNYRTLYDASTPNDYLNWCTVGIQNATKDDGIQMAFDGTFESCFVLESNKSYKIFKPSVFEPIISHPTGVYINSVDLTLTPQPSDGNVYYTLDGSIPTVNSILYSAPINITSNCTLKAISEKNGVVSSAFSQETYFIEQQGTATIGNVEFWGEAALENSPYYLNGNITVPNAECLTIEPGVEIYFTGNYKFIVQGCLNANGTEENPIKFDSYTNLTDFWAGVEFNTPDVANSSSLINYCEFKNSYANSTTSPDYNGGAIFVKNWNNLTISNCLFEYNKADNNGGAIFLNFADIDIFNNIFRYNSAMFGGAIEFRNSTCHIYDNIIEYNYADYGGGIAVNLNSSGAIIENNIIRYNTKRTEIEYNYGGGLYATNSGATIRNNEISYNTATETGGGVYLSLCDNIQFLNNTVSYNQTTYTLKVITGISDEVNINISNQKNKNIFNGYEILVNDKIKPLVSDIIAENNRGFGNGGGMQIEGGTGNIFNNKIYRNISTSVGGGVSYETSTINFSSNLIFENTAQSGGGIAIKTSNSTFANNTIINNSAVSYGDGIYVRSNSFPEFYNCFVMYNRGDGYYGDIFVANDGSVPDFFNCSVAYGYDGVDGDYLGAWTYTGTMLNCVEHFPNFIYEIEIPVGVDNFSGLINTGIENTSTLTLPTTDLNGNLRIFDDRIDIGCFENQTPFDFNVIGGEMSGDLSTGVYYVDENITVPQGQTLTIQPGTEINFYGNYGIDVLGNINAIGTEENPIIFDITDKTDFDVNLYYYGGWRNINFYDAPKSSFSYCNFSNSKLVNIFPFNEYLFGGFLNVYNSIADISYCNFLNTNTLAFGGALSFIDCVSNSNVDNSTFSNCKTGTFYGWEMTGGEGGAIYIQNASPQIVGNIFTENISTTYSGGYPKGGAVHILNSHSNLVNNTFVNNFSYNGGAILVLEVEEITLKNDLDFVNNIFWGNNTNDGTHGKQLYIGDATNLIEFYNNDVEGGYSDIFLPDDFFGIFENNIEENPLFIDFDNLNLQLFETSPCVEAGKQDLLSYDMPEFDIFQNPRNYYCFTDIGAAEFWAENNFPIVENNIDNQSGYKNQLFTFEIPENTFSDVDACDNLIFTATLSDDSALPEWLNFENGVLSGTPATAQILNIKVAATDEQNASISTTFELSILEQSNQNDILTFVLAEQTQNAIIDNENHTVEIEVETGTNITDLTPTITVSVYATINPLSSVSQNFTNPVTYTVTAEDGTPQEWIVSVSVADFILENENYVTIYPNPVTDFVIIYSNFEVKSFSITDLSGKFILKQFEHSNNFQINLKSLNSGIYILTIENLNGEFSRSKFVKK